MQSMQQLRLKSGLSRHSARALVPIIYLCLSVSMMGSTPVVKSIVFDDGKAFASVEWQHSQKWIKVGENIGSWTLTAIDFAREEAQFLDQNATLLTARLPPDLVKNSWDSWIRSRDNPMFFRPVSLGEQERQGWHLLSPSRRAAILEFYRRYGWELKVNFLSDRISVEYRPIHQREQAAALRAEYNRFRDSLSPDDAKAFDVQYLKTNIRSLTEAGVPEVTRKTQLSIAAQREFEALRKNLLSPPQTIKHP